MLRAQLQEDISPSYRMHFKLWRKYTLKCIKSKKDQSMTRKLAIVLALSTTAACNTSTGNLPESAHRL